MGLSGGPSTKPLHFGPLRAKVERQKSSFWPNSHSNVLPMVYRCCRHLTWVMGEKFGWVVISSHMGNQDYFSRLVVVLALSEWTPKWCLDAENPLEPSKASKDQVSKPRPPRYDHREWTKVFLGSTEVKKPRSKFSPLILAVFAHLEASHQTSKDHISASASLKLTSRGSIWSWDQAQQDVHTTFSEQISSSGSKTDFSKNVRHFPSPVDEITGDSLVTKSVMEYDSASH